MSNPTEVAKPPPTKRARTSSSTSSAASASGQKVNAAVEFLRKADMGKREAFFRNITDREELQHMRYFVHYFEQFYGEPFAQLEEIPFPEGETALAMKKGAFALAAKLKFEKLPKEETPSDDIDDLFDDF